MLKNQPVEGKRILITGATGSLGKALVRRLLGGELGNARQITLFSRDEAKQHAMRMQYLQKRVATDEVIYRDAERLLDFRIGDIRDLHSVTGALRDVDVVFNAAALKQVPTCEYFPFEAVQTNVVGAENIVRAIESHNLPVETVVGVSTDKACKPVNVMGMTKALQERILIQANARCRNTRFVCVRYGNVLASRGSVIPLFHDQINSGGPVTVTTPEMTRFLLSLDEAVDLIFAAVRMGVRGETFIPNIPAARVVDVAEVLIGDRPIEVLFTGVRPGEKIHEILISEEERFRAEPRGNLFVLEPALPELRGKSTISNPLDAEFSSESLLMTKAEVHECLKRHGLLIAPANPNTADSPS